MDDVLRVGDCVQTSYMLLYFYKDLSFVDINKVRGYCVFHFMENPRQLCHRCPESCDAIRIV